MGKLFASKGNLHIKVILSYIFDYVIIVVLIGLFYAVDRIPPFKQEFSLQNYTLHYKFATKERVPVSLLIVLVVFVPTAIIALYTLVIDGMFSHEPRISGNRVIRNKPYSWNHRLWELNCGLLGLGLSTAAAFMITGSLKNAIGKPRPDMIDRCNPPANATDPPDFGLSNATICSPQVSAYILNDGFKSFPSGHASGAFAGLFYLSLYLAGKLHILDSKGEVWKSFIVIVPTVGAALIAGSRIMDARHHPFDVISGGMLGMLVAWGSYRQYFPPLHETWRKGRAYPVRSWGKPNPPPHGGQWSVAPTGDTNYPPTAKVQDEERQPLSGPSTSALPTAADLEQAGGNQFQAQLGASFRHRQNQIAHKPSSTYSSDPPHDPSLQYTNTLPSNPFAERYHDDLDQHYSSAEDDEGYELKPQYTLRGPHSSASRLFGVSTPPTDPAAHYSEDRAASPLPPQASSAQPGQRNQETMQPPAPTPSAAETLTLAGSAHDRESPSPSMIPQAPPGVLEHATERRGVELSDGPRS